MREWQSTDHMDPGPSIASDYFHGLERTAKTRYKEKLSILGEIEDPYLHWGKGMVEEEWQNWPKVEYLHIYN